MSTKRIQELEAALERLIIAASEVIDNPEEGMLGALDGEVKQAEEVLALPYTEA